MKALVYGRAQAGAGQRITGQGDVALLLRIQPVDLPDATLPVAVAASGRAQTAALPTTTTQRSRLAKERTWQTN